MALSTIIQTSQSKFLMAGGMFEMPLQKLREDGILASEHVHHEYPKWLHLDGKDTLVHSEAEEERVLSGGLTSSALEEQREHLVSRCRNAGIQVDPAWTIVRLKRELGDAMDAPPEEDRMARLQRELAYERKIADMEAELASLRAKRDGAPVAEDARSEADELRATLTAHGVDVDGRWSVPRLRKELDRVQEEAA